MPMVSDAEAERLEILVEEASEVQKAAMKILRHGWLAEHPDHPNGFDNRADLTQELGDLDCAMKRLYRRGDVDSSAVMRASSEKEETIKPYLRFQ